MTRRVQAEIQLDFERRGRVGLDEAIFAQGKSAAQLDCILATAYERSGALLVTRLSAAKFASIDRRWSSRLDYCEVSESAFFGPVPAMSAAEPAIAIVAGGSSDARVAREVERTLAFNAVASTSFIDVGVAGLWRLTACLDALRRFPVIVAVAGMEAALPTVLGGLVPGLIVAVPTSVGYGVAEGGRAALSALLASCAPGITVVNIDNGYGAACAALRALGVTARRAAIHSNRTITGAANGAS